MPIVNGFTEKYGNSVKKSNYVELKLMSIAYKYCYDEIKIPIIEYYTSFDESVVGKSPWPEWNEKGIFSFKIENYYDSYFEKPEMENVLLIPEGTTSVTRWLGDKINNNDYSFPMKIFYNIDCYRNELINSLTKNKRREFKQFGYEILGSKCIFADCEILNIVFESLKCIGIDNENVRIRINNVEIYKLLCDESGIDEKDSIILKEKLDYLAECKAGKHPEKIHETIDETFKFIGKYKLSNEILERWKLIIDNTSGDITDIFYKAFDEKYRKIFDDLKELKNSFKEENKNLFIDLCVIRSHEYYTGISFEIDVLYPNKKYIEIAGGGRFDRLVSNFIEEEKKFMVPCTGFAFGTQRVIEMLDELKLLDNMENLELSFKDNREIVYPKNNSISSYFEEKKRLKNSKSINIFVGKF